MGKGGERSKIWANKTYSSVARFTGAGRKRQRGVKEGLTWRRRKALGTIKQTDVDLHMDWVGTEKDAALWGGREE